MGFKKRSNTSKMCLLQVLWLVMQENICLLELAHGAKKSSWYHYHLYIDTLSVESNVHRGKPSLNITPKAQMIKSNILGKSVLCSKWKGKMPNEFPEHWDCSVLKSIGQWTLLHSLQRCSCYISFELDESRPKLWTYQPGVRDQEHLIGHQHKL